MNTIGFLHLPRATRRLVFYSEGRNYWPHLKGLVFECLAKAEVPVVYLTSDFGDPGLDLEHSNFKGFVIGDGGIRTWLFENVDTDVMVMTMPDLNTYQIKRSRYNVHYVYVQHSLASLHMIYRKGAFDHFDTVFCAGTHHRAEIQAMMALAGLPPKKLVNHGYSRLDAIMKVNTKQQRPEPQPDQPLHVLVAPSWGMSGVIETLGQDLTDCLMASGFRVTLRPHPQTMKTAGAILRCIMEKHGGNPRFTLEHDVAGQESLHSSDIMISDWSGAALDYSLGLEKPVVFIDVPRKVNNPDYEKLNIEPLEVSIREKIGVIVPPDRLSTLPETIEKLVENPVGVREIQRIRDEIVFNVGSPDQFGACKLLELLQQ